ncbi:MAG: DUF3520 domain-containing protein [Dehalococcoidia bacterium]|nr:DUF3520 domain-containing protein [Dehalococcoidia bacterium]
MTALYEAKLHDGSEGTMATVYVRYQDPESGEVEQVQQSFLRSQVGSDFEEASAGFQLAAVVAEYAEILRDSYWARAGSLADVQAETGRLLRLMSSDADVEEFAALVSRAQRLEESASNR